MHPGKIAPSEILKPTSKAIVFYSSEPSETILWTELPVSHLDTLDRTMQVVSYQVWPFDLYFGFLGQRVRDRIRLICNSLLDCVAQVSLRLTTATQDQQRRASLRAIRRHKIKLLRRYYQGCFLTKLFLRKLQALINNLSADIASYCRYQNRCWQLTPPARTSQYVNWELGLCRPVVIRGAFMLYSKCY